MWLGIYGAIDKSYISWWKTSFAQANEGGIYCVITRLFDSFNRNH